MKNPFIGSGVALVTPFNDDLSIDFDALRKLVEYQIENGTDFLVVQGTTGESPVLSWDEKMAVLATVIQQNEGRLKIVFGVGGNNTVQVAEQFKKIPSGVDGILSVSPYYNKPSQKGIIEHYKYISSCTELPIILYNVPGRTGSNMSATTTLELSKIKNIVAVKEASGDFAQIIDIIKDMPSDFSLLSGDDLITFPMMSIGAEGVISVVANCFPKLFSKMVHAAHNGDYKTAKKLHFELVDITNLLFEEGNPGGAKASLAHQSIMGAKMRAPLYPISSDLQKRIHIETDRLLKL